MAKITWTNRTDTGDDATRAISASLFNDTKTSVNAVYDTIEARLGTTSSANNVDLIISGTINISGSLIPNVGAADENTSSFDLGSPTAAWGEIYVATSSLNFVEGDGTITKWSKNDVAKLKLGKSLRTGDNKQFVNEVDDTTYIRASAAGRMVTYAGNNVAIDAKSDQVTLGGLAGASTGLPVTMPGGVTALNGASITGSVNITGSSVYTTTDLLTLLGNFGQTGSFGVSGSASFTGDVNMDGTVTTQDLLTVVAGMNTTGSVNVTGSTDITGSVGILPPPLVITENSIPGTNTLFYGYVFNGGVPDILQVQAANYFANNITYFRFSTSSQDAFNSLTPENQDVFFTEVSASASNGQTTEITFTPVAQFPSHSYKYAVNSVVDNGTYYQTNVTFIESSSLSGTAPSVIDFSGGGANGRWKFVTLPAEEDEPTGGFNSGDLLDFLSVFGATGVQPGSFGDFNFDGQVTVADLMLLLAGFGNPQEACSDLVYQSNTNNNIAGPVFTICDGYTLTVNDNAFVTIT